MMTDVIDTSMMQIGNRLRHFRLLKGLTQTQFADELGIDSKYYSAVENSHRFFRLDTLIRVCKYYGITLNDLIPLPLEDEDPHIKSKLLQSVTESLGQLSSKELSILQAVIASF